MQTAVGVVLPSALSHTGSTRALLGLGIALANTDREVHLLVPDRAENVSSYLRHEGLRDANVHVVESSRQTFDVIKDLKLNWLMAGDYLPHLRLLDKVRVLTGMKVCAYAQVPFGLNTLRPHSAGSRSRPALVTAGSWIPWRLLTSEYRNILSRFDVILANSHHTELLLTHLYGLLPTSTVYPPVASTFLDFGSKSEDPASRSGSLLYLGKSPWEVTDSASVVALVDMLSSVWGPEVTVFGGATASDIPESTSPGVSFSFLQHLSDNDLRNAYARHAVTALPQRWESFGYVGPESLACGTPVLALNRQPWIELVGESPVVEICDPLVGPISLDMYVPFSRAKDHDFRQVAARLREEASVAAAAAKLDKALKDRPVRPTRP